MTSGFLLGGTANKAAVEMRTGASIRDAARLTPARNDGERVAMTTAGRGGWFNARIARALAERVATKSLLQISAVK